MLKVKYQAIKMAPKSFISLFCPTSPFLVLLKRKRHNRVPCCPLHSYARDYDIWRVMCITLHMNSKLEAQNKWCHSEPMCWLIGMQCTPLCSTQNAVLTPVDDAGDRTHPVIVSFMLQAAELDAASCCGLLLGFLILHVDVTNKHIQEESEEY